ncbi:hypothetical protein [Paenibacillus sonchi]|uniref:hypothetical protein n=1 Tax=Paenibacillus sonchi TaxID=373687 RepID=UPI001E4B497E|nr:hypothetical protein [Paenibacillus sonchi]
MITFTDGAALICVIPSDSSNGVYLVRAEPMGDILLISHECPACNFNKKRSCRHVAIASEMYKRWQWWEPAKEIKTVTKRIVLQPDWEPVTLSVTMEEALRAVSVHAS